MGSRLRGECAGRIDYIGNRKPLDAGWGRGWDESKDDFGWTASGGGIGAERRFGQGAQAAEREEI